MRTIFKGKREEQRLSIALITVLLAGVWFVGCNGAPASKNHGAPNTAQAAKPGSDCNSDVACPSYLGSIEVNNESGAQTGRSDCLGTLVSENTVVTAKSCIGSPSLYLSDLSQIQASKETLIASLSDACRTAVSVRFNATTNLSEQSIPCARVVELYDYQSQWSTGAIDGLVVIELASAPNRKPVVQFANTAQERFGLNGYQRVEATGDIQVKKSSDRQTLSIGSPLVDKHGVLRGVVVEDGVFNLNSEQSAISLYLVNGAATSTPTKRSKEVPFDTRQKLSKIAALKSQYQRHEKMRALYEPSVQAKAHSVLGHGVSMKETEAEYHAELLPFLGELKMAYQKCLSAMPNDVNQFCEMPKVPSLPLLWMNLGIFSRTSR